jgi:hypothetical protein
MPHVRSNYRNELFVRVGDDTLAWLDETRGEEARSTYIRRLIEQEAAKRDILREVNGNGGLRIIVDGEV